MARYPKVDTHCPVRDNLSAFMDGEDCTFCQRQVHDLSAMSGAERDAFFKTCQGEVCVMYRIPLRPILAAAAAAAALAIPLSFATSAAAQDNDASDVVIVGAITDPSQVQHVDAPAAAAPELPVVYETAPAAEAANQAPSAASADAATDLEQRVHS